MKKNRTKKDKINQAKYRHLVNERGALLELMHELASFKLSTRQAFYDKITELARNCVDSNSAVFFRLKADNSLVVESSLGLFAPQKKSDFLEKAQSKAQILEEILKNQTYELGEGLIGKVAKNGEALFIENAQADPRVINYEESSLKLNSIIACPLISNETLLGVLVVANPIDNLFFTNDDFSIITLLADQAGICLENLNNISYLIERKSFQFDLNLAKNVQSLLLPSEFPKFKDLDFAALYCPAKKVGGDFYDIIKLSPTKIGICIADVSGKGIAASILMAVCLTYLRQFASEHLSPENVLKNINKQLFKVMKKKMYVTMTYLVIDTSSATLTFAKAGHEKPFLMNKIDKNEPAWGQFLNSSGMALGMVDEKIFNSTITKQCVPFEKGSYLVLYTDGIIESRNDKDEEFSSERFEYYCLENYDKSAQELLNILQEKSSAFGDEQSRDDMTAVSVKFL